jgi:hypothetical protein
MRRLMLLLAVALVAGVLASGAGAHGDPASEYLATHQVFFPIRLPLPQADQVRLSLLVRAANRRGYQIRVAVIGSRFDLGIEGDAWAKPVEYATNITEDVAYTYRGPILVVMPRGLGLHQVGRASASDQALLDRIRPSAGPRGLAAAAIEGVRVLAAAHGVRLAVPRDVVTEAQRNRHDRIVIAVAAAIGLALWGLARLLGRRRAAAPA